MKLEIKPCPCGLCEKKLASPLFHAVDATLYEDEVKELVARWNAFEEGGVAEHLKGQLERATKPDKDSESDIDISGRGGDRYGSTE